MNLFDLTGKKALVTGSSRGIGRALAEGVLEAGAEVVVNGVGDLKGIAVFLASNASNYISGAIIPVDGGFLAR